MTAADPQAKIAAAQVLTGLYEAIADHSQLEVLFEAMDEFLDLEGVDQALNDDHWPAFFRRHFQNVSHYLEDQTQDEVTSPAAYVEKQVVPAAIITRSFETVASNRLFDALFQNAGERLSEACADPDDHRRLAALFQANSPTPPTMLRMELPNSTTPVFVVAAQSSLHGTTKSAGPLVSLRLVKATWNDALNPLLEGAYGLTEAEIAVLSGLFELGSTARVAEVRGRSIRTVRTQVTNIFGKLGLKSQTELALFLATLTQLITEEAPTLAVPLPSEVSALDQYRYQTVSVDGREVAYLTYGDPTGTPVLAINSTTPPEVTPDFRQLCAKHNFQIIAPIKPGSSGSTRRPAKDGPEALASDYKAVLDAQGISEAFVAGFCSGGLYALEFANSFPKRCGGIVLCDTGAPILDHDELMALPAPIRRTFIPARYMPEILLVPHKLMAANFHRSAAGEAKVVNYFFNSSPTDQALTESIPHFYDMTRKIIAHSFEDVPRLVADVQRWASNWNPALDVLQTHPCVFVHGTENTMFRIERVRAVAEYCPAAHLIEVEGAGQLQFYQQPEHFISALETLRQA